MYADKLHGNSQGQLVRQDDQQDADEEVEEWVSK